MARRKITFCCPHCDIKLSIAADQAGLSGPCPNCGDTIQSPAPQQELPLGDFGLMEVVEEAAPQAPPSTPYPKVIGRLQADEVIPADQMLEALHSDPVVPDLPQPESEPLVIHERSSSHSGVKTSNYYWWVAAGAALLMVFFSSRLVMHVFSDSPPSEVDVSDGAPSGDVVELDEPVKPKLVAPVIGDLADKSDVTTRVPDSPAKVAPVLVLPKHGFMEHTPEQVLRKFLEAETLEERLPLMVSQTGQVELMASCLSGGLMPVKSVELDMSDMDQVTKSIDHYFSVEFSKSEASQEYLLLVRLKEGQGPRVIADPFIDSYGGRLAKFASTPVRGEIEVQVMVSPRASCIDESIPDSGQKRSLDLMGCEYGDVLAVAHFSKLSDIEKLLNDGTYRLSYGNPVPAVVRLRWNRSESSQKPFLEAVEIKGFRWGS